MVLADEQRESQPWTDAPAIGRWRTILLVLAINIGLRVGYSATHPGALTEDADGYLAHAQMMADGKGFAGPSTGKPTAFRPPGYPFALAVAMRLGFGPGASVAVINMLSAMLILWLIRLLGRQMGLAPMATLAAQLAAAVDPLLVRYTVAPMTEIECAALLLGAIVVLREAQRPELSAKSCGRWCVVAGVLFGLGTFVRPVVAVCCGMVTALVVCRAWRLRRGAGGLTPTARQGTLLVLVPVAAFLTLLPWIVRNERVFGKFIPATTHGGYTLALGNNADFYRDVINGSDEFPWDGASLDAWQQRMIAEMQRDGIARADEPAEDAWYYRQALSSMRADPWSCAKATLLRLRRFWALTIAGGAGDELPRGARLLIGSWYLIVWIGLGLSVVGCRVWRKSKQSDAGVLSSTADLWLVILAFVLMHAFYWTDTRMRAPVMPILLVLSVSGWSGLFVTMSKSKQA